MTRMMSAFMLMIGAGLVAAPLLAQSDVGGVVFKSRSELMAVLDSRAKAVPGPEMMAANVKSGDRFMINVVRRTRPQGAIAHDVGSEIHSIIDGTATLVTGGTIVRPSSTPSERGNGTIQNGESRRVETGDVVMVPPQTPHWYSQVNGQITYLEIRFDVGAPAGGTAVAVRDTAISSVLAAKAAATPPQLMFSAPVARGEKFQANIVVRRSPQGGGAHELGTEVHQILAGAGTLVTGGRIVRGSTPAASATIEGGQSHRVGPGDVVLIPANTPHWYKDVDAGLRYLEVRFELPRP